MDRAAFIAWKTAFTDFVTCGRSQAPKEDCIAAWERSAARFIDDAHRNYVREAANYYLTTRLRSSNEEQQLYCKPLKPGAWRERGKPRFSAGDQAFLRPFIADVRTLSGSHPLKEEKT